MKKPALRRHAAGFSLMELVVVVAIIVVLAALTLVGMSFINAKQARDKAALQVKLLDLAIEDYHSDNKTYPSHQDSEGLKGDEVLYKALYYDGFEAKESGGTIYLADLDPENNTKGGQAWMKGTGPTAQIVDPWGNSYRYRSGDAPDSRNPDFDVWSCGPDGKTNPDPKNKDSLDDIGNW
jgi:prepilin-type N-terminal cleavage/methylation domain-containing protein